MLLTWQRLRHLRRIYKHVQRPRTPANWKLSAGLCQRLSIHTIYQDEDYDVDMAEIRHFLRDHRLPFTMGHTCLSLSCPLCSISGKGTPKAGKLYINANTGLFLCLTCNHSGSWADFRESLKAAQEYAKGGSRNRSYVVSTGEREMEETRKLAGITDSSISLESLSSTRIQQLLDAYEIKSLNPRTFINYGARLSSDDSTILLPLQGYDGIVKGYKSIKKVESCEEDESDRVVEEWVAGMDKALLFGINRVRDNKEVVLTANILDALAIHQASKFPVLALPFGLSLLPLSLLPYMERFSTITLWLGGDASAWEATRTFARKLGINRVHYARCEDGSSGGYDALRKERSIQQILKKSLPVSHPNITSFSSLRDHIRAELVNTEQYIGVKWTKFEKLNSLLQGHRRGELTVLTGPTGSGKTTFMSEYSLDLVGQGVSTLWCSFEIHHVRLAKVMLRQFAAKPLDQLTDNFEDWADKFESLPVYFMTLHGAQNIQKVLQAMKHAVYLYDIAHCVVDNVQFLLGVSQSNRSDQMWRQDLTIQLFRSFASLHNCHVTLVIHPRKEKNGEDLSLMSIYGGVKATQEADNVLILQDRRLARARGRQYLQVAKNRFSGDLGLVPLFFNKDSLSFSSKGKP